MSEAPDDIQRAAEAAWNILPVSHVEAMRDPITSAIANMIIAERRRCLKVLAADKEWGADFDEAMDRIRTGGEPRYIPGWSD